MEKSIEFYKQCIKQLLIEYEDLRTEGAQIELVFDDERMHYMAVWIGWEAYKRVHQCAIHINICDDKVVIQWNDTEALLDEELINLGVPRENIQLALLPPQVQAFEKQYRHSVVA